MDVKENVYIWQLSEKNDEIDKLNDITMIHDGSMLKKITMNGLYEYFNQDYKINNIIEYFENEINNFDNKYNPYYKDLENLMSYYDQLIKELQNKFNSNRDNIRNLEKRISQMELDNEDSSKVFASIDRKSNTLSSTFENFNNKVTQLKRKSGIISNNIIQLNENIYELVENINYTYDNFQHMIDMIDSIGKHEYLNSEKDVIIKHIESEYDKIISIIDYYHHIHDD